MDETGAGSVSPKRASICSRSGALTRATSHAAKPPSVSAGGEPRADAVSLLGGGRVGAAEDWVRAPRRFEGAGARRTN